jgi:hypothetical protein
VKRILVNQLRAKNCSSGNIVAIIQEKRPEVNVSFCPNELGQNETNVKYTEIFKNSKIF